MIKLLKRMRRREALMALVCAVLVVAQVYFDLKLPDYMTRLTTLIKTPGSVTSDILSVGGQMLLCTLASAVLAVGCGYLAAKTASGFSFSVRADLFHHVMDAGSEEMQSFSVPSLITRTTNDITQIQMIVAMGLQMLMKAPIMAVWAVIKILGKSWTLSAVTGGVVVAIVVMVLLIMSSCLPRFRQVQKKTDQINRVARENLTGINVVHAFGAEDYQNRKFDGPSRDMMNLQLKNQRLFALLQPMLGLGMNGLALAIYWVGAALVESIALTDPAARLTMFTNVLVFSTYATYVVMSFMMLVMIFMLVPQAQVSAERINEVLDTKPHVVPGTKTEGEERGTVEFRDVSFRYPGAAADELEHISFKVRKGQTLAVIGATGSGKTTLASLIPRFYDATAGTVLVDGVDVRAYTFDALYNKLGYVTQKAVLFSGTVEDNVFFGQSAAEKTDASLQAALSLSQAAEFVDKYPEKAAHPIAQLGRNVSGGQKQRLSIARALARKPEILIFDDSFSALDYKTDAVLREGLAKQLPGTTKIIVAQRISTIRNADQILVLDRGEIAGLGTHDELMVSCPVYREIAMSQLSEEELKKRRRVQMRPNMRPMEKTDLKGALNDLSTYMRKSLGVVVLALVLAALSAVLTIIGPDQVGKIATIMSDGLLGGIDLAAIARVGILLAVIYGLSALFGFIQHYIMASVTLKMSYRMRAELSEKINRVPQKYFNFHAQGDILSRITNDVSTLQQGLTNSLPTIISAATQFLGCLIMMFVTEWRLALVSLGITLVGLLLVVFIMSRSQKYFTARQESLGKLNGYVEEMYSGHEVVRISRAAEPVGKTFDTLNDAVYDANWRSQFLSGVMQPLMNVIGNLSYVAVCVLGSILAIQGIIDIGVIVSFILYVRLFTSPLTQIAQGMTNLQTASASAHRIFDFLGSEEMPDESEKPELPPTRARRSGL